MLQAVMTEPGKIEFNEIKKPSIKRDQILIKMKRIGFCDSDIHVHYAKHPYTSYPVVQNRELKLVGTVIYKKEDYVKSIKLVEVKKVNLKPLITNHFEFKDYIKAYEFIEEQKDKTMKVIIDL